MVISKCRGVLGWLAVLVTATALLSGCGSGNGSSGGSGGSLKDNPAVSDYVLGDWNQMKTIDSICPKDDITVGYADGVNNPWRAAALAELKDEASKCGSKIKIIYVNAEGDASKAISDINGLVARGVDALILHEDSGQAVLPAIRSATKAGVIVVTTDSATGCVVGTDCLAAVNGSANNDVTGMFGEAYTQWMVKALKGKGDIIHLGGGAGNPYSAGITEGMDKVVAQNPGIKILEENVTTNYDPAECQKVAASLIAKYKEIDGIVSDYGACTAAAMRAFTAAKRPWPPSTGDDENVFACSWADNKTTEPSYQIAIGDSRPWGTRLALRRAVAGVAGVAWDEPTDFKPKLVGDSLDSSNLPACDPNMPPDSFTKSSMLTPDQLKAIYN